MSGADEIISVFGIDYRLHPTDPVVKWQVRYDECDEWEDIDGGQTHSWLDALAAARAEVERVAKERACLGTDAFPWECRCDRCHEDTAKEVHRLMDEVQRERATAAAATRRAEALAVALEAAADDLEAFGAHSPRCEHFGSCRCGLADAIEDARAALAGGRGEGDSRAPEKIRAEWPCPTCAAGMLDTAVRPCGTCRGVGRVAVLLEMAPEAPEASDGR